ncbi:methylated-DNA--[protein]-cysteine S-methyltransferase [Streptomyces sp. MST-110588]|uniref:methylated-DNA--[protein]-cysteine S-methyltransferase n=1 Tax=Streptomyces sp. MST-110588 TaxID=2833628 RepID=UPI001F5CEED3|nr:methylated-DNA--[protein]-cysteine S-methyltransferase [Streptomyces sp. MST-110588]UNO38693.1 methylated-DNA--[protein]-cysteine S-methyltransferase [Streptomyces sp. MST-110588]
MALHTTAPATAFPPTPPSTVTATATATATAAGSSTLYASIGSPLGELLLVGEESPTARGGIALASLSMSGQKGAAIVQDGWRRAPEAFAEIAEQLAAYFDGARTHFDIDRVIGRGTAFQQRVWDALETIPYGTTTSYGALAEAAGISRAAVRALGTAIGANPLLIVRPCHRVIGANGTLTGYAGGLERKRRLLDLEQA